MRATFRFVPILIGILLIAGAVSPSFAYTTTTDSDVKGFYPDEIVFFEVSDEDLAVSQVKAGDAELYLWRIPAARASEVLKDPSVGSIQAANSYTGFVFNPASVDGKLNPFSIKEFRQTVSRYLIDREFIVNEVLKGLGEDLHATIGPYHPDYIHIIDQVEALKARSGYDPALADEQITAILTAAGATKMQGKWIFDNEPITLKIFIRIDDPVRKALGDKFASDLQAQGFDVETIFGDLRKAFTVVYGSDPVAQDWHVYTEGWSFTAITKFADSNAAFFYAPFLGNMPGWGTEGFWQYQNPQLDEITQKLFEGNYADLDERSQLLAEAYRRGLDESVRTFVAVELTNFVYNRDSVENITYDLFGGPLTYWFYRTVKLKAEDVGGTLRLPQKLMYQGAYNTVNGFGDVYSSNELKAISDPSTWPHPHTGLYLPYRVNWNVETAGPTGTLMVPQDALKVDVGKQSFVEVGEGVKATTKVTYNVKMSNFHHGQPMTVADLIHPFFFLFDWGIEDSTEDLRYDGEYARGSSPTRNTFVGFKIIDENIIEVYHNYWHPDESFIGAWMTAYSSTPWELDAVMEDVVANQKAAFSRARAASLDVEWLDLTKGPSLEALRESLATLKNANFIPEYLKPYVTPEEAGKRWQALENWANTRGHFLVSNGPYFFDRADVTAKQDVLKAFRDPTYPFSPGDFDFLVNPKFAEIAKIEAPPSVEIGKNAEVTLQVNVGGVPSNNADVAFLLLNSEGDVAIKGTALPGTRQGDFVIILNSEATSKLPVGAYTLRAIATAFDAARPSTVVAGMIVIPPTETTPARTPTLTPTLEAVSTPQPTVAPETPSQPQPPTPPTPEATISQQPATPQEVNQEPPTALFVIIAGIVIVVAVAGGFITIRRRRTKV